MVGGLLFAYGQSSTNALHADESDYDNVTTSIVTKQAAGAAKDSLSFGLKVAGGVIAFGGAAAVALLIL